jgi:hypothetical protein
MQGFGLLLKVYNLRILKYTRSYTTLREATLFGWGATARNKSERVLYRQPTGPNPLHHLDDLVDCPRAMAD